MARWVVQVSGGELSDEARSMLEVAGAEATAGDERGFEVSLEAEDSATARHSVERALRQVKDGGYSAGAATKSGGGG